jgi:hypothetical protein
MKTIANRQSEIGNSPTYHTYVSTRQRELRENPEVEGKAIYYGLMQMVAFAEDGFSLEAKLSFPRIRHAFSRLSLMVWIGAMQSWFKNLSPRDRKLFRTSKFPA